MKRNYRFTASRKRALHKAQLISARKRKGRGQKKKMSRGAKIATVGVLSAGAVSLTGGAAYARHKASGSMLYVGGRTESIPNVIAGVNLGFVGKTGFNLSKYEPTEGFALTYRSRNKKGDKLISYRHKPVTMGQAKEYGSRVAKRGILSVHRNVAVARPAVRSMFGRQIGGGPRTVVNHTPEAAIDMDVYAQVNRMTFTSSTRLHRKVIQKHGNSVVLDRNGNKVKVNTIDMFKGRTMDRVSYPDVLRRVNAYKRIMAGKGITISQAQETALRAMIGKERY